MKPKIKTITSKQEIREPFPDLYIIDTNGNEKTARAIIESLKQKKYQGETALQGGDDSFNRRVLETLKINYLISPEKFTDKDTLKQRDSGLNHVLGKIAKQNNIAIVIDFNDISGIKDRKGKAVRIAKVIQNVKICRKAGCKILIWGNDDKYALQSFGFSIGMSSQQVGESI